MSFASGEQRDKKVIEVFLKCLPSSATAVEKWGSHLDSCAIGENSDSSDSADRRQHQFVSAIDNILDQVAMAVEHVYACTKATFHFYLQWYHHINKSI